MVLGQIQCHDVSVSYKTSILVFTTNLLSPRWPCHGFTLMLMFGISQEFFAQIHTSRMEGPCTHGK